MHLLTLNRFEDRADIALLEIRGKPGLVVGQLANALEYEDPRDLRELLDRSEDLIEGEDRALIEGDELAALKALAPHLVGARAASVTLLFESGINLAIMLSQQPKAKAFRRWLATEVIPSIRRTGSYTMPGAAPTQAPPFALPHALRGSPAGAVWELLKTEAEVGRELPEMRAALIRLPLPEEEPRGVQALERTNKRLKVQVAALTKEKDAMEARLRDAVKRRDEAEMAVAKETWKLIRAEEIRVRAEREDDKREARELAVLVVERVAMMAAHLKTRGWSVPYLNSSGLRAAFRAAGEPYSKVGIELLTGFDGLLSHTWSEGGLMAVVRAVEVMNKLDELLEDVIYPPSH